MSELIRVTHDEDDNLDEFVARGVNVHFERMGDGQWWAGIDLENGDSWHLNFGTVNPRAKVYARADLNP
ncbi:hypothetical protein [Gryllotalpicola koreensis]|uniref:Uncharacterized protein n=1 Tax=Gryllotalpicola koreensis TaxID=993086 RepID=A0ABP8A210_9MICO